MLAYDLELVEHGDRIGRPPRPRRRDVLGVWGHPQVVVRGARQSLLITHMPGHMFVTDLTDDAPRGPSDGGWLTS